MNIFLPIRRNARAFPNRVALVLDGTEMTYDQLLRATALVSARLAERGVAMGDTVGISVAHPASYLLIALAIARLGATVAPFSLSWPDEQVSAVLARHGITAMISDAGKPWQHPAVPAERFMAAQDLLKGSSGPVSFKLPPVPTDTGGRPWLIGMSSGTTGRPKSIPQTHESAVLGACLNASQAAPDDLDRVLVYASLHLVMAMNRLLPQLIAGRTAVLVTHRTPENFFAAVERDRPTYVTTSTGNAVQLVAHAAQAMPDSLSKCGSLRFISVAGSAVSQALLAQLRQYICPNIEIIYGSSEANRIARATPETLAARPDSTGRVCPWVEMEAVDDEGKTLPVGQAGALRVRSAILAGSYVGDAEATARAYRDGWYYPGDTGHVDNAGYLTLTGRVDDLINLGGNKIDPFLIEAVLDAQPGVDESVVVAVDRADGRPALIALVVASGAFDEQALKNACLERLGAHYVPRRVRRVESIPRNSGGKVMRKEIAARVAKLAPKSPETD